MTSITRSNVTRFLRDLHRAYQQPGQVHVTSIFVISMLVAALIAEFFPQLLGGH